MNFGLKTMMICALVLAACGGRRSPPTDTATTQVNADVQKLKEYIRAQGGADVGPHKVRPNFRMGKRVGYRFKANVGECYLVWGIVGSGSSVAVNVVDTTGQTLGNPDAARAYAHQFCAAGSGTHLGRYTMRQGVSTIGYGVSRIPSSFDGSEIFATLNAGSPAPSGSSVDPGAALVAEGFVEESGTGNKFTLPHNGEKQVETGLEKDTCYAFVASADKDVALYITNLKGKDLAVRDEGVKSSRTVRLCAKSSSQIRVLTVQRGDEGEVMLRKFRKASDTTTTGTGSNTETDNDPSMSDALSQRVGELDKEMENRGYKKIGSVTLVGRLSAGDTKQTRMKLTEGNCYAFSATADQSSAKVQLFLENTSGTLLAKDIEHVGQPSVRVCVPKTDSYILRIRSDAGTFQYAASAYKWPRGTAGPYGLKGVMYVRLAEMSQLLSTRGYQPDFGLDPLQGSIVAGRSVTHDIELSKGVCYSVVAVGSEGILDLELGLYESGDRLGQDSTHTPFPHVDYCPDANIVASVTLKSAESGKYHIQVFAK